MYLCFNLFGGNLLSYVYKIQSSFTTANMSEEEDANSEGGKEGFGSKEEKLHNSPFQFTAVLIHLTCEIVNISSDDKIVNHSFEISSPPPNC